MILIAHVAGKVTDKGISPSQAASEYRALLEALLEETPLRVTAVQVAPSSNDLPTMTFDN